MSCPGCVVFPAGESCAAMRAMRRRCAPIPPAFPRTLPGSFRMRPGVGPLCARSTAVRRPLSAPRPPLWALLPRFCMSLHAPLQITAWCCMGSSWPGCARARRLDPMKPRSLSPAELVGALVRDAPHDFPDLLPGLLLHLEALRDLLPVPPAEQLKLPLQLLGDVNEGCPALVKVGDVAQLLVVGRERSVRGVGHDVRVRAFRRSLKTQLENFSWALDSSTRALY